MKSLSPQLQGFDLWEPHIRSFVALDDQAQSDEGALRGLKVGVKDIIDVRGLPTRNGSAACGDAAPATADATVVAALRASGARIVGKTVSTEFAFTDPTDCRNPYDLARSPGGSSSGSGAAVAAGIVDLALGTQTAGSLCRPAAYCGVVGLKPGYGVLSTTGVTPLAPSFDSVGIIARSVEVARLGFQAASGQPEAQNDDTQVICGLFAGDAVATPDASEAFEAAGSALGLSGNPGSDARFDIDLEAIVTAHRIVMHFEAAHAHHALLHAGTVNNLRPNFRAALERGMALSTAEVSQARRILTEANAAFWRSMDGVDAILTLPVPDGAPLLDGTTGFQDWLTPWTVFGGPLVSLPWGLDRLGRPRAVMLAGRPGFDARLLALAARLEALAPPLPRPKPPQL